MNVNKNRLEELVEKVLELHHSCQGCPLCDKSGGMSCAPENEKYKIPIKGKYGTTSYCFDTVLNWLQDFDVAEALEEGAHIVNDQVIFPLEAIPCEPYYGTPCEEVNRRGKADWWCEAAYCDYADCCPYSQSHSCPFDDKTCFNYGTTEPCLNCPYAE